MGFFDKIKQSLTKTTQQFVDRFDEVARRADAPDVRSREIDLDTVEALEEALISADVGVAATERIIAAVRNRRGRDTRSEEHTSELQSQSNLVCRLLLEKKKKKRKQEKAQRKK